MLTPELKNYIFQHKVLYRQLLILYTLVFENDDYNPNKIYQICDAAIYIMENIRRNVDLEQYVNFDNDINKNVKLLEPLAIFVYNHYHYVVELKSSDLDQHKEEIMTFIKEHKELYRDCLMMYANNTEYKNGCFDVNILNDKLINNIFCYELIKKHSQNGHALEQICAWVHEDFISN